MAFFKKFDWIFRRKTQLASDKCPIRLLNLIYWLARRDAAVAQFMSIMDSSIFSYSLEDRKKVYEIGLSLMEDALKSYEVIDLSCKKEDSFQFFLRKLYNELNIILLSVEQNLVDLKKRNELNSFLDESSIMAQLDIMKETFNKHELAMIHSMVDFLVMSSPNVYKMRSQMKRLLTKSELERYNRIFAEYELYYRHFQIPRLTSSGDDSADSH